MMAIRERRESFREGFRVVRGVSWRIKTAQPSDIRTEEPNAPLAAAIVSRVTGCAPAAVRRFRTGARHHVFDIAFKDRRPVVARIGHPSARKGMAGAMYLSELLRPRGVPLPAIQAADTQAERPWLVLERLPGTELGAVIAGLPDCQLDRIAASVVQAQVITANTGTAGRYGYAIRPEEALHSVWSEVLDAHLARSRRRIASAGLFDAGLVDRVQSELTIMRDAIDRVSPTPFLHDTTTRNVIVTPEGGFSGIVDVDDLCFGDPRYPAALTMAVLMAQGRACRLCHRLAAVRGAARRPGVPALRERLSAGPDVQARPDIQRQ
jgi:aminoglycoside phosphotransferase